MLSRDEAIQKINAYAANETPFVFFTDFLGSKVWIKPTAEIAESELRFQFSDHPQNTTYSTHLESFRFEKRPIPFEEFESSFKQVISEINFGNSFLVNLTFQSPIETNLSLDQIFNISHAKYKLRFKDQFVVFSPETFVKIKDGFIYSYPMKGTIDAKVPNAESQLLNDPKELAEHVTITDLIRNDLSQIADEVQVTKFRFVSEVKTRDKILLQVSTEVRGKLLENHLANLGTLLFKLLPAGSITGAPKHKTVEIIERIENYPRGFYTGICGHFDGKNLDSGVMIRFIEKEQNQLYYKSGGGITSFSKAEKEYQELIDKIYVPI
ncbi:MAG: para-aminobenzoate synthetase component 1 [Cyclobacteriaceae bacterium]|jgi:para-aminobenzoate synthetase component 1